MVDEYSARVEQTLPAVNMKDPELDIFEWSQELLEKRTRKAQDAPAQDVDYGARREVGKDGVSRAPKDGNLYVRAKKGQKGPETKKPRGKKKTTTDDTWMYDGEFNIALCYW